MPAVGTGDLREHVSRQRRLQLLIDRAGVVCRVGHRRRSGRRFDRKTIPARDPSVPVENVACRPGLSTDSTPKLRVPLDFLPNAPEAFQAIAPPQRVTGHQCWNNWNAADAACATLLGANRWIVIFSHTDPKFCSGVSRTNYIRWGSATPQSTSRIEEPRQRARDAPLVPSRPITVYRRHPSREINGNIQWALCPWIRGNIIDPNGGTRRNSCRERIHFRR